jgi:hypothetical protein
MRFKRRDDSPIQKFRFLVSLGFLILGVQAQAQNAHVQLVISVSDANGAAISGASVTVKQEGCQCGQCPAEVKDCPSQCCDTRTNPPSCCIVALTRTSNDDGDATFEVNAGRYSARIEVRNFKAMEVKEIQVTPGQSNKVEVKLETGVSFNDVVIQNKQSVQNISTSNNLKVLTIQLENESNIRANVAVTIRRVGCTCGECPTDKICPSGCCECKENDCVCCIVASEITNGVGERSFSVKPGRYDVSFKIEDMSWGTFSGVTVDPKVKETKLPVTILKAQPPQ